MPALMYHDVVPAGAEDSSGFPGRGAALYKVTPELFAAHLAALRDFLAARTFPPVVLTFDDGGVSAIRTADILEQYGFRGHFFATVNYIGTAGFVDARDIRELRRQGHTVGSHSCSHPLRMGHRSWPQLVDEWTRSRTTLEGIVGAEVRTASVPGGDFTPQVAEAAARAGFTSLFTSEPTREARHAFGLTLIGRYTIRRWTSAGTVARLAAGAWGPRTRQAVIWGAKKISKRVGGKQYLRVRCLLLGQGDDERRDDESG